MGLTQLEQDMAARREEYVASQQPMPAVLKKKLDEERESAPLTAQDVFNHVDTGGSTIVAGADGIVYSQVYDAE